MIKIGISLFIVGYLVTSGVISFSTSGDVLSVNLNYKNFYSESQKQIQNIQEIRNNNG